MKNSTLSLPETAETFLPMESWLEKQREIVLTMLSGDIRYLYRGEHHQERTTERTARLTPEEARQFAKEWHEKQRATCDKALSLLQPFFPKENGVKVDIVLDGDLENGYSSGILLQSGDQKCLITGGALHAEGSEYWIYLDKTVIAIDREILLPHLKLTVDLQDGSGTYGED